MRYGGSFEARFPAPAATAHEMVAMAASMPFAVDAHAFERTLGWAATPLPEGMARTVAWYRRRDEA